MARWVTHRTDNGSKALIKYAESIGLEFDSVGGKLDGFVWLGRHVRLVDFKSKGGELTPAQSKLVARGCPVNFVSTPAQLDALKTEMLRGDR